MREFVFLSDAAHEFTNYKSMGLGVISLTYPV